MNIYKTNLFPYIAGDSLVQKSVTLTMTHVTEEKLPARNGKEVDKLVLYFQETDKGLVLNKTNCKTIALIYGGETEDWNGKQIELHAERIQAFGQWHNAVRVSMPKPENGNGHMPEQIEFADEAA